MNCLFKKFQKVTPILKKAYGKVQNPSFIPKIFPKYEKILSQKEKEFMNLENNKKWKFIKKKNDISLFQMKLTNSKFHFFKTEFFLDNCDINDVYKVLFSHDPKRILDVYSNLMTYFTVLHEHSTHNDNSFYEVIHEVMNFTGESDPKKKKVMDREFLYAYKTIIHDDSIVGIGLSFDEKDEKEIPLVEECNIRGTMYGGMIIQKSGNGCKCIKMVHSDPKGEFWPIVFNLGCKLTHIKTHQKMKNFFYSEQKKKQLKK